eukprot:248504_1
MTNNNTLNLSIQSCNSSYLIIKSNDNDYIQTPLYSYKINAQIIGSKYINKLPFTTSYIYGLNPIHNCYDTLNMNIDILSLHHDHIKNTIPTLFIYSNCNYYNVLL